MTIQQLMDAVANLGFESEIGDVDAISETVFFPALNKAVYKVNEIRPRMGEVTIAHTPLHAVFSTEPFSHSTNDVELHAGNAISFSFKVRGNGSFRVLVTDKNGNTDTNVSVTRNGENAIADGDEYAFGTSLRETVFRCFVGNRNGELPDIKVIFTGIYYYTVMRFTFFGDAISDSPNDVPLYNDYVEYSLPEYAPDFLSLQRGSVMGTNGSTLVYAKDYLIKNDRVLMIPWGSEPLYLNVTYTRKLWQYSVDGATDEYGVLRETIGNNPLNAEIDIDEDLAQLLPNLVAFYVLQDDDPQKANNYYQIFIGEYNEKKSLERRTSPTPYEMKRTWG